MQAVSLFSRYAPRLAAFGNVDEVDPLATIPDLRRFYNITTRTLAEKTFLDDNDVAKRSAVARDCFDRALRLSTQDPLTGAYNRRFFDDVFASRFRNSKMTGSTVSLLALDFDKFKLVNDKFGHETGDVALRALTRVLQGAVRRVNRDKDDDDADMVCRLGGEEFAILFNNGETPETIEKITRRVLNLMPALSRESHRRASGEATSISAEDGEVLNRVSDADLEALAPLFEKRDLTVSVGALNMAIPKAVQHPKEIFEMADQALYKAKTAMGPSYRTRNQAYWAVTEGKPRFMASGDKARIPLTLKDQLRRLGARGRNFLVSEDTGYFAPPMIK